MGNRPATPEEIQKMQAMVEKGMAAGAVVSRRV